MTLFRIIFLLMSGASIAGVTYVSSLGYGAESKDLKPSIRAASSGRSVNGNIK